MTRTCTRAAQRCIVTALNKQLAGAMVDRRLRATAQLMAGRCSCIGQNETPAQLKCSRCCRRWGTWLRGSRGWSAAARMRQSGAMIWAQLHGRMLIGRPRKAS